MTETTELPTFPKARSCPFDPPTEYSRLREDQPVARVLLPTGKPAWLVTRHAYARQLLADSRVSVDRSAPGYPALVPGIAGFGRQIKGFLTWMDPPEHTTHRRMLLNEFTVRRIQAIRPQIQRIVDGALDEMLSGQKPVDLVEALARPVPTQVICELLGVPYADRDLFHKRASVLDNREATPEQKIAALREMYAYLGELVVEKDQAPADDLLSRLVAKYREAGIYDHEVLTGIAVLVLTGGHETTANMIALGVVALLEKPEQRAALMADPAGAAPGAVEELLRYFSIAEYSTSRVATADIEIDGVLIRAGEGIIALNSAADRDKRVFADPDALDIARDTGQHMAFGYGIHQCLGQNLARLELQIVYTTLFERVPSLRLAIPFDEVPFKESANFYGIHEVPVTW